MITLLADSGLSRAAEAHYTAAIHAATTTDNSESTNAATDNSEGTTAASAAVLSSLLFRGAVLIPAVYDNQVITITFHAYHRIVVH